METTAGKRRLKSGRLLRRFLQLPRQRKLLLVNATVVLIRCAYLVRRRTFAQLTALLGVQNQETAREPTPEELEFARDVEWAIAAAQRHLPYSFTCLMQSLAGKMLFARRNIPSILYIGVGPLAPGDSINAHAWLCCGTQVVTGRTEQEQHVPMVWYG